MAHQQASRFSLGRHFFASSDINITRIQFFVDALGKKIKRRLLDARPP
jgi:hypothetical protein